jgi:hypothetical protein
VTAAVVVYAVLSLRDRRPWASRGDADITPVHAGPAADRSRFDWKAARGGILGPEAGGTRRQERPARRSTRSWSAWCGRMTHLLPVGVVTLLYSELVEVRAAAG